MRQANPVIATFLLLIGAGIHAADLPRRITTVAGDYDRHDSLVRFALPAPTGHLLHLEDEHGNLMPLQTDTHGNASFIEKDLKHGSQKAYRLVEGESKLDSHDGVQAAREGSRIKFAIDGRLVFYYQADPSQLPRPDIKPLYRRGGYLHPVLTPSGKLVSDDYAPNHLHHHGVWFSWAHAEFEGRHPDFWNMGEAKGTTEFVALDKTWSGSVHGGFQSEHRFVDLTTPDRVVALNETWLVTVYNVGKGPHPYWMFDLVSTQNCATVSPLKLPHYLYGGLGFRGNWDWNGKDKTFFLTSEGESDRGKANGTSGRWCHVSGKAAGQSAGIAILCHPENFRAPQPMRVHPAEPFFSFAPQQAADMEIAPGKPYVSRYRFIVADGPPDKAELDNLWNDYAYPAAVRLE